MCVYIGGLNYGWPEDDEEPQRCSPDKVKQMQASLDRLRKRASETGALTDADDRRDVAGIASDFSRVLELTMIRRSTETRWFGNPIVSLPSMDHRDLPCLLTDAHARCLALLLSRHAERWRHDRGTYIIVGCNRVRRIRSQSHVAPSGSPQPDRRGFYPRVLEDTTDTRIHDEKTAPSQA